MNTFLKNSTETGSLPPSISVFCISSAQPTPFACAALRKILSQKLAISFFSIGLDCSFDQLRIQATTEFLGQKNILWLGDLELREQADQLADFCSRYAGPHILFCAARTVPRNAYEIKIPEVLDREQVRECAQLFCESSLGDQITTMLFGMVRTVTLEQVLRIIQYVQVVGKNQSDFCTKWLNRIIEPEQSLFTVSQYFFARDARSFWKLWALVHAAYPIEFWISLWSEQVWQAYDVVERLNKNEKPPSRTRLPFSFMQRDWKKQSCVELAALLSALYALDFQIKNGSSSVDSVVGLEVIFAKFFEKKY